MLKGKTVVLGVTGSIAAYKIANLASMLVKLHADVHVIMTKNATEFINPVTFETLTAHKCLVDTFDRNFEYSVEHVSLGQKADVMLIAPATANVIGKLAHGIADDMLTTTAMAMRAPIIVSPAMNTRMYENPILQDNLQILKKYGMEVIEPASGFLACRDIGAGKMPEPETLLAYILRTIQCEKDLLGKKVLVTAGPTMEAIDPVRFISNHSTGKMGYAIARAAMLRGAQVTLISGPTSIPEVSFVDTVRVKSAEDMATEVLSRSHKMDYIICSAAVADYTPVSVADQKIKKQDGDMSIPLKRTTDILKTVGEQKGENQVICGFSMETTNLLENSRKKLDSKKCDMIVANDLNTDGAGFGVDTNQVVLITRKEEMRLPLLSKDEVAHKILDALSTIK